MTNLFASIWTSGCVRIFSLVTHHALATFARRVNGLHQREAAAPLFSIASRLGTGSNSLQKIFQHRLMTSRVTDHRGRRARITVSRGTLH